MCQTIKEMAYKVKQVVIENIKYMIEKITATDQVIMRSCYTSIL